MSRVMKNITVLGQALDKIEVLVVEMGGFIEPGMEVCQSVTANNEGEVWAKATLAFDLAKLKEYIAQHPQSFNWVGLSGDQKKDNPIPMDGISEPVKEKKKEKLWKM